MDVFLAAWLARTVGPCLYIVGAALDGGGDKLLEDLLRFRRVLFCPVGNEA